MKKPVKRQTKPQTPEQKQARLERLAAARAKRIESGAYEYASIHESVKNLPHEHPLSLVNVKKWLKVNKDMRQTYAKGFRVNDPDHYHRYLKHDTYIKNMEQYLRDGVWTDLFYGEQQQNKINYIVRCYSYHTNGPYEGMIKRSVGFFYPDIGLFTQEMYDEYYNINIEKPKKKRNVKSN